MTGNELMLGDTIDSNSAMIAQSLLSISLQIDIKITVGDSLEALVNNIRQLNSSYDIVIINGGLGPTQDDLTSEALSAALGLTLIENNEAKRHVMAWCQKRNLAINDANLKQAILPENAVIFPDAPGSAAGQFLQTEVADNHKFP